MTLSHRFALLFAALTLCLGYQTTEVMAQTQCPVGTAAGSATCGPDAPSASYTPSAPPPVRERVQGLAAFAYNVDTGTVYSLSTHGYSQHSAKEAALQKCRQPNHSYELSMSPPSGPDARCEPIIDWQNGCAAVAVGQVQGVTRYFSQPAANARAARTAAIGQCQANGGNCTMAHDAVCVRRTTRNYEF